MRGDYDAKLSEEEKEHVKRNQMDEDFYLRLGFDKVARNMGISKIELEEMMFKVPRITTRIDWSDFEWEMYRRVKSGTEKALASINGAPVPLQVGNEQVEMTLGELREALKVRHAGLEQERQRLIGVGESDEAIQAIERQLEEYSSTHASTTLLLTDAKDEIETEISNLLQRDTTFAEALQKCDETQSLNKSLGSTVGTFSQPPKF
ncbi:hypothetical protein ACFSSA_13490 [Luteolibacter algae]|uniref:Uncharacterized protein n=1 Tax=Luteolibacter algae TaxID=454151 RepID=A0ABW5DDG2_9BACT